jgi:hypothetical protein
MEGNSGEFVDGRTMDINKGHIKMGYPWLHSLEILLES